MKPQIGRSIISAVICTWIALVQPGVSAWWLMDPQVHAKIDLEEFGQTPDGRTLPGHPWHPPHNHPTSAALGISDLIQQNAFDAAFYEIVFRPAHEPALQGQALEIEVIATATDLAPPDHPPRA